MAVELRGRLRRIGWQLPLSIATLLLAVVAAFSWAAYREVRRAALDAAGERLQDVTRQLASLLAQSVELRVAETRRVADDPAVVAALASDGGERSLARHALERLLESDERVRAVELWDTAGRHVLAARRVERSGAEPVHGTFPVWAVGDTASVGGFRSAGDAVWYEVVVPARQGEQILGSVVQRRELSSSAQAGRLIADLIGTDATLLVGEPGGTWTDFSHLMEGPAPAVAVAADAVEYQDSGGSWSLGAGMAIPATPWRVWVEFPRAVVLSRPRAFVGRILSIGLVMVILGALCGWALSRRVTTPLEQVTTAASAMARGEDPQPVPVGRRDELGELAEAFNAMAERVKNAQRRLEQKVAERTAEFRAFRLLFASNPLPMWVYDLENLKFLEVNESAIDHYGYTRDEFLAMRLTDIRPPEDVPRLLGDFAQPRPTFSHSGEWRHRLKDGRVIDVEITSHTLVFGEQPSALVVAQDVTERKRVRLEIEQLTAGLERRVRDRTAQLEAANEELGAFSYSVSHDLRAPLRSIHGFSRALLEDYGDKLEGKGADYLHRVAAATERMGQLIDDLLELSRVTRSDLKRRPVDLTALGQQIAAGLRRQDPEREVEFRIADHLAVDADPRLLQVVLENLLENAWKFTAKQPIARIELDVAELDGERAYFVRDDGAGFDMTYVDRLFGAFQRLHAASEFPGTGIGLATVQRIISRHGGRVWAEGSVGEGATFYFTL